MIIIYNITESNIISTNFRKDTIITVNYPSPKGNGLVTAQSYEWLMPPTFNPDRHITFRGVTL